MADNHAFESWRSTWLQYGPIVVAAAQVLHPLATAEDLRALVVESAARGFVDTERVDPLDALLGSLLRERSPIERTEVAKALVANGIDHSRAAAVTGGEAARITSPVRESGDEVANVQIPEFDAVRTCAADYETHSPDFSTERLVTRPETEFTEAGAADDGAIDKRLRKRWSILVAGFGVVCVLAAGAIPVGRELLKAKTSTQRSIGFLIAKDIPEEWELIDAKAFVSFPSIGPTVVAQRFTNADKTITILLSTNSNGKQQYSDPALGVKQPDEYPFEQSRRESKAQVMGGPGQSQERTKSKSLFKFWGEQKTFSYMQSDGLTREGADSFAAALTPRANLAKEGWASRDARFIETAFLPDVSSSDRYQSTLEFWLKSNHALRVTVSSSKAVDPQTLDFYWGPNLQTVTLGSGRVLRKTQNNPLPGYQWYEGKNSSFAQTSLLLDTMTPPPSGTQGVPQAFLGASPSTQDLAKVEGLLDALHIGNVKLWRKQLAELRPINWDAAVQSSNLNAVTTEDLRAQKLGVLNRTSLQIDPNQLELMGSAVHGKAVGLCTKILCTRIYRDSESTTDSADLLIDGHWWHFENLATNEDEPTFRTSPSSTGGGDVMIFPTAEAALDKSYRWWGIDFGTEVQAARRNEQRELFLRPIQ
jgi:hypothetical protein